VHLRAEHVECKLIEENQTQHQQFGAWPNYVTN
jgi:hypothetical protein